MLSSLLCYNLVLYQISDFSTNVKKLGKEQNEMHDRKLPPLSLVVFVRKTWSRTRAACWRKVGDFSKQYAIRFPSSKQENMEVDGIFFGLRTRLS